MRIKLILVEMEKILKKVSILIQKSQLKQSPNLENQIHKQVKMDQKI